MTALQIKTLEDRCEALARTALQLRQRVEDLEQLQTELSEADQHIKKVETRLGGAFVVIQELTKSMSNNPTARERMLLGTIEQATGLPLLQSSKVAACQ